MRVTTRTGKNTYVSMSATTYTVGWFVMAVIVLLLVVAAAYFVLCWPEALVQALAPKNTVLVVLGWIGSAIWSVFLLGALLVRWLKED